jgi:hypothetical protein
MGRWLRRLGFVAIWVIIGVLVIALGARFAFGKPRPEGVVGPDAEALADRVAAAVDLDAWARTGAVQWTLFGHRYLWDRKRNLVRYEDGRGVVLTEGWRPMGRAFRDGEEVGGEWKDRRVRHAYASFVNDAFWAFGPTKIRDEGTVLSVDDGALLVTYPTGGVTPGDAYRWEIGPDGLPVAFRIWAGVLPIPGLRVEWADWTLLDTGVRVARTRAAGPFRFGVDELGAAADLSVLAPDADPFAPMFGP